MKGKLNIAMNNKNINQAATLKTVEQQEPAAEVIKNNNFVSSENGNQPIEVGKVPLGYQFEQWQRPPSRQKEPNLALGLDDTRPKTRGRNNASSNVMNVYGAPERQGMMIERQNAPKYDRQRNLQQYIPQKTYILHPQSGKVIRPQIGASLRQQHTNQVVVPTKQRMIDFFHQRKNPNTGYNMNTSDSAYAYFQPNQLGPEEILKKGQAEGSQQTENPSTKNSLKALQNKHGAQAGHQLSTHNYNYQISSLVESDNPSLVRPPSRHKDPTQNLGLEFPEKVTKQQDLKELKGGFFSLDIGDTFVQLDIDGLDGFEVQSEGPNEFDQEATLKHMGKVVEKDYGNVTQPIRLPAKRFKEDDEDFYDAQFLNGLSMDKRINR